MPLWASAGRAREMPARASAVLEEEGPRCPARPRRAGCRWATTTTRPARSAAGCSSSAALVAGERGGEPAARTVGPRSAPVSEPRAGRQVERDHRALGGIRSASMSAGHEPAGGAVEAGAEERVDHDVGAPRSRASRSRSASTPISSTRPRQRPSAARGVAAHVVAPCDQEDAHARARGPEPARHDEAVAAIVPLAAEHRRRAPADGARTRAR